MFSYATDKHVVMSSPSVGRHYGHIHILLLYPLYSRGEFQSLPLVEYLLLKGAWERPLSGNDQPPFYDRQETL